jgi:C-terminal peptidase prc
MSSLRSVLPLACLTLLPGPLLAEQTRRPTRNSPDATGSDSQRVQWLIRQLGSKNFRDREEATRALDAVGERALFALCQASATSEDAEVRHRAAALVEILDQRWDEATDFARRIGEVTRLLATNDLSESKQGEWAAWGVRGLYEEFGETIPARIAERLRTARDLKEPELLALLREARLHLACRRSPDKGLDTQFAMRHMLRPLDPHAEFMVNHRWIGCCAYRPVGIGVQLCADARTGLVRVQTPIKDGPAYRAGVRADDLITEVTYLTDRTGTPLDPPEVTGTWGRSVAEVEALLQGRSGSLLHLRVQRDGVAVALEFDVARGPCVEETVLGVRRRPDDSWDYSLDASNQICYVRLTRLQRETYQELAGLLAGLRKEQIKGLVFDLRFSPGGTLESAVRICNLFINRGVIVTIRTRRDENENEVHRVKHGAHYRSFPMVCLINNDSARASEIVAACLQDHRRAVIIGERSQGVASIQRVMDCPGVDGLLRFTSAAFCRPSGKKLDKIKIAGRPDDEWGVTPDRGYAMPLSAKEREQLADYLQMRTFIYPPGRPVKPSEPGFRDRQLEAAVAYLRREIAARGAEPRR